jgi:hypothetical protein
VIHSRLNGDRPAEVVASFTGWLPAAQHQVDNLVLVEPGTLASAARTI